MRVAILTGGAGGVGRAVSRQLRDAGRVVVALRTVDEAEGDPQPDIQTVRCDLSDPDACLAAVSEVESTVGKVEILINSLDLCRLKPFHEMSVDDWHDVVNVNLHSLYNVCRPIIPGMRDRKFGRVVNISSVIGQMGGENQTSYAASKAAVIGFTRALALENARYGITVNAVAPGWIATVARLGGAGPAAPEPPVGRLGSLEEVASCVSFLAAEASGFITGETLNINGGGYLS